VILLAYNRGDYLQQMVDAIELHTHWPHRLTIVDNASGPRTRQWLRSNSERFHQIIWNSRNEHLAGHQRGIAATESEMFVLSDADLLPHPPTDDGCWLTRLMSLSERYPDFGLIGTRLDSVSDARNRHLESSPTLDGEIIQANTGVWLNLMRRSALRIPYMSDGITCYALRRAGYRIGVAANVYCTHLGDQDPLLHPAYLASKQASSGLGSVYPSYPEIEQASHPATLEQLALAAPVLAELEQRGVRAEDTVELSRERWPELSSVEPAIECAVRARRSAGARWSYRGRSPLAEGGALAVAVICASRHDEQLLNDAFQSAGKWVVLLSGESTPQIGSGWRLQCELPGPNPVLQGLLKITRRRRWRARVGYSTSEEREQWLGLMRSGAFGESTPLRLYVFERERPLEPAPWRWRDPLSGEELAANGSGEITPPTPPRRRSPLRRANRVGALLTKLSRLIRAEWYLRHR
jgi:hypothetical protein